MKIFKRTHSSANGYAVIMPISKVLSPICTVLYHAAAVILALLVVMALIMLFVNVPADQMILPPRMAAIKDSTGTITEYSLKLGNGIKVFTDAGDITLSHIKTVFYCRIASYVLALAMSIPIFKLLSDILKKVGGGDIFNESNARYINYIGVVVTAGNLLVSILNNVFNYVQINKFLGNDGGVAYSFDIDWMSILPGVFILIAGTIYGCACRRYNDSIPPIPSEISEEENEQ